MGLRDQKDTGPPIQRPDAGFHCDQRGRLTGTLTIQLALALVPWNNCDTHVSLFLLFDLLFIYLFVCLICRE